MRHLLPRPYLHGVLHLLLRHSLQIRWWTWCLSSSSQVFMILVPAVDIGSAIWNLISGNKGSLQTLLSVRENWVKCLFSIGTIDQGYFHFNNQTLNFWHLRKDICHIWVWYDPDWDWSGGNDQGVRYISIVQSARFHPYFWIVHTNTENLSLWLCS